MSAARRHAVSTSNMFTAAGIKRVVGWNPQGGSGSLYNFQVRTLLNGDEIGIGQGGLTFTPPFGDPLSVWRRRPGEQTFSFERHLIFRDMNELFPHTGSTAAGSWFIDEKGVIGPAGRAHILFCPAISDPMDPSSFYLRNFVLMHATTDDFIDVRIASYGKPHEHPLVQKSALYFGNFPVRVPSDVAFGISGACPVLASDGYLYIVLKLYTERGQKNGLVRRQYLASEFEAWCGDALGWQWCENGLIPWKIVSTLGTWYPDVWSVGNPFMWAIDSVYELPRLIPDCKFVGVTGQQLAKDGPQLALIGSNDMMHWSGPFAIDISSGGMFAAVNYRFMDPATKRVCFASNGGSAEDANMGTVVYEGTLK